jgi:hypothetical protein
MWRLTYVPAAQVGCSSAAVPPVGSAGVSPSGMRGVTPGRSAGEDACATLSQHARREFLTTDRNPLTGILVRYFSF